MAVGEFTGTTGSDAMQCFCGTDSTIMYSKRNYRMLKLRCLRMYEKPKQRHHEIEHIHSRQYRTVNSSRKTDLLSIK